MGFGLTNIGLSGSWLEPIHSSRGAMILKAPYVRLKVKLSLRKVLRESGFMIILSWNFIGYTTG